MTSFLKGGLRRISDSLVLNGVEGVLLYNKARKIKTKNSRTSPYTPARVISSQPFFSPKSLPNPRRK
jgi:hypothetical protein